MGVFLLLLLFGDGTPYRPLPRAKLAETQKDPDPTPAPKAKPKKETAAERRKRLADEKRLHELLEALTKQQGNSGIIGVLRSEKPSASIFGKDDQLLTPPPPANDREAIHRVVQAHASAVRYCYEKELAQKPDLAGRITTRFTIDETGAVTEAAIVGTTLADAAVETCVLRQIFSWKFPAKKTTVTYPFRFENGG